MATSTTLVSGVERIAPHGLQQVVAREEPARLLDEETQQRELLGREARRSESAGRRVRFSVELQVAHGDSARRTRSATRQRAHTRRQRGGRHGLDDVFVRAGVERSFDVGVGTASRADHDRRFESLRPQRFDEPDAVVRREAHVQHDDVVASGVGEAEGRFSRLGLVDGKTVGGQGAGKRAPYGGFVFDQQDVEGTLAHARKADETRAAPPVRRED